MKTSKQFHDYLKRHKMLKISREQGKSQKRLNRKIYYEVYYYNPDEAGKLTEYIFCSRKKARKFVKNLYNKYLSQRLYLEIVKVWVYRRYQPRHKTFYDYEPCGDKWIKSHSY